MILGPRGNAAGLLGFLMTCFTVTREKPRLQLKPRPVVHRFVVARSLACGKLGKRGAAGSAFPAPSLFSPWHRTIQGLVPLPYIVEDGLCGAFSSSGALKVVAEDYHRQGPLERLNEQIKAAPGPACEEMPRCAPHKHGFAGFWYQPRKRERHFQCPAREPNAPK
ncbi:hypothetical protein F5148DRAFT_250862 [Russula earlei]|uniref:Uncharacterized protein n=1 Tax=Russula earlei TaxID=71964 RepID=A0ACC0U3T4_9AGAM|nr:hypothetical protein F5148DRAFT_250862 [Russula earlei]